MSPYTIVFMCSCKKAAWKSAKTVGIASGYNGGLHCIIVAEPSFVIQCDAVQAPVTRWCNNPSLPEKRPVRIKSQIQYLCNVPGFRSAGHNCHMQYAFTNFDNTKQERKIQSQLWKILLKRSMSAH